MTRLKLADDLSLPLTAVTEKLAWLGRTGSGKTYGAMKLAELMLDAGAQVGAIDPVGVWRALRVPADKHGKAFDVVVFGGLYGDLPLEPTQAAGQLVADLVVDRGLSFVLDVSQFIPSEQQEFARGFAHRFFHRKKSTPSAVHLFMEECQEFIPENPSGKEALTLGEFQRLWKLGRNFGIGGSLISQRPQEIAKKALNMSGTLFAFQMTGPQERKAIKSWVADQGIATDIESVLQRLQVGEPHVESPTFLQASTTIRILPRTTADLSSTPKVGAATAAKRALTPIDVEQLKSQMAATIEKAKADDPRELRKTIATLQKEITEWKKVPHVTTVTAAPTIVEKPVLTDNDRAVLAKLGQSIEGAASLMHDDLVLAGQRLKNAVDTALATYGGEIVSAAVRAEKALTTQLEKASAQKVLGKLAHIQPPATTNATPRSPLARRVAPAMAQATSSRPARQVSQNGDATIGRGERTILTAVAQHDGGVTREQLTVLTGYKRSSRDTYLQRLGASGLVEVMADRIVVTEAGVHALGADFEPLPTGDDLRAYWLERLPEGERRILQTLVAHGTRPVDRDALSEATGYKRSSRDTYLQRLSARRLVVADRNGVRASEELFS